MEVHAAAADAPKHHFDWYTLLPTFLTIMAAVVGYAIVERFARMRESRADLRVMAASFREAVDAILADASVFYGVAGATPRARALAIVIKSKIASLSEILEIMKKGGVDAEADDELLLFRQSVTGGDFDSMARGPLAADAAAYVDIAASAQQLQRKVDLSFYRAFLKRSASRMH